MHARDRNRKVQTTLRLPKQLYEQARAFVEHGHTTAESMNDFFIAAIQAYTRMLRRKRIDAGFASMSSDADYQNLAQSLTEEFATSDWESLGAGAEGNEGNHAAR